MKIHPTHKPKSRNGYALLLVMVMAAASILIYSSAAKWTSTSVVLNDRNNTYNGAVAAAEAATEVVLGYMTRDFFNQSFDPTRLELLWQLHSHHRLGRQRTSSAMGPAASTRAGFTARRRW